jgi:hypothetical protein
MEINLSNLNGINFNGQPVQSLVIGGNTIWNAGGSPSPVVDEYFTIEAQSSGQLDVKAKNYNYRVTFKYWINTTPNDAKDNYTGIYTSSTSPGKINIQNGDVIRIYKDSNTGWCNSSSSSQYNSFEMTFDSIIYGNIGSLVNYNTTLPNYAFYYLFYNCNKIKDASGLYFPFATLNNYSCLMMFYNCTGLTKAPELPATTLGQSCYQYMFYGCTSLTTAPTILPATTLAQSCYNSMFSGCSNLTTAPELPATTLVNYCYSAMFYGCSKLNYVKALFTTTPSDTYTQMWLQNVSSTGTFVKNSAATWTNRGVNAVPTRWTIETAAA